MADVETIPVSDEVNKCLTEFAGKVQGGSLRFEQEQGIKSRGIKDPSDDPDE